MDIVKNHPYQLCDMAGIGFKTADHIAMSMGFDQLSTERVDEGLLYTLADAEAKGHLCMEKHEFVKACLKILDTPALTSEMVANRAARLVFSGAARSGKDGSDAGTFHYHWWTWNRKDFDTTCHFRYLSKKQSQK